MVLFLQAYVSNFLTHTHTHTHTHREGKTGFANRLHLVQLPIYLKTIFITQRLSDELLSSLPYPFTEFEELTALYSMLWHPPVSPGWRDVFSQMLGGPLAVSPLQKSSSAEEDGHFAKIKPSPWRQPTSMPGLREGATPLLPSQVSSVAAAQAFVDTSQHPSFRHLSLPRAASFSPHRCRFKECTQQTPPSQSLRPRRPCSAHHHHQSTTTKTLRQKDFYKIKML